MSSGRLRSLLGENAAERGHRGRWRAGDAVSRVAGRVAGRSYAGLEHPPSSSDEPRWGQGSAPHPELAEIIAARDGVYAARLQEIAGFRDDMAGIPVQQGDPREPAWVNGWFPGLDGASLYGFIRSRSPRRYVEVGSGTSTLFADRARRDGSLGTTITSIDPQPRKEIDAVCDSVVRAPLEVADLGVFAELGEGDVLLLDGSHCVFMNSDVSVFFLEVLPRLAKGVLVGVHDIYLPADYPAEVADRHYSEQYMLAAYLLAGAPFVQPVLPCSYVSGHPELSHALDALWEAPGMAGVERHGVAFWFETGS